MSLLDDVIQNFGKTALAGGLAPVTARTEAARSSEENRSAKAAKDLLDNQLTQERIIGQQKSNRNSDQDYATQQVTTRGNELSNESAEIKLMEQAVQGMLKGEDVDRIAGTAAEGGMLEGIYGSANLEEMKAAISQALVEISLKPTDENISQMTGLLKATRWDFYQNEKKRAGEESKAAKTEERAAAEEKRKQQGRADDVNEERRKEEKHQQTISEFERERTNLSPDAEKLKADITKQVQKETDPLAGTGSPRAYSQIVEEYARLGLPGAQGLAQESGVKVQTPAQMQAGAQGTINQFEQGGVATDEAGANAFNQFVNSQGGPPQPAKEQLGSALDLAPRMAAPEEQQGADENALTAEYKEFFAAAEGGQVDYNQMSTALQDFLIAFAESNGGVIPKPDELEAAIEKGRSLE